MVWYSYVIPWYGITMSYQGMVWYYFVMVWYGMVSLCHGMVWLWDGSTPLHWVNLGHGVLYILYLVLPCFSKFIIFCYAYMESNLKKVDIIIQIFKAGRQKSIKFIQLLTSGRLRSHDSVDPGFFLSQSKLSIPLQSFGQQNLVLLLIYPWTQEHKVLVKLALCVDQTKKTWDINDNNTIW